MCGINVCPYDVSDIVTIMPKFSLYQDKNSDVLLAISGTGW